MSKNVKLAIFGGVVVGLGAIGACIGIGIIEAACHNVSAQQKWCRAGGDCF